MGINSWSALKKQIIKKEFVGNILILSHSEDKAQKLGVSIAKYLLCEKKQVYICDKCNSCKYVTKNTHPNFLDAYQLMNEKSLFLVQIRKWFENIKINLSIKEKSVLLIGNMRSLPLQALNFISRILENNEKNIIIISHSSFIKDVSNRLLSYFYMVNIYDYNKLNEVNTKCLQGLVHNFNCFKNTKILAFKLISLFKRLDNIIDTWVHLCSKILRNSFILRNSSKLNKKIWIFYDILLYSKEFVKKNGTHRNQLLISSLLVTYIKLKKL